MTKEDIIRKNLDLHADGSYIEIKEKSIDDIKYGI